MNRIDRLNALLIHLQSKPRVSIDELEQRFEVSRRTIFRDIRSLINSGVPIGGNAGDGYFIVEGYHLPPVVFNKEEAAAILLGAKFIEKNTDTQTAASFEKAMYKIKSVLKYSDKEFLDNLESKITIMSRPRTERFPDSHIAEIQLAIATSKLISIAYFSGYKNDFTNREVEPLGMVFYSNHWHLIGFCRLRKALRDFRADRIQKVKILPETIDTNQHPDYLDFLTETLSNTDAKEAVLRCSKEMARVMKETRYHHGFIEEEEEGDYMRMKFIVPRYDWLAQWLMMYGNQVDIISPPELQAITATLARDAMEHHSRALLSEKI